MFFFVHKMKECVSTPVLCEAILLKFSLMSTSEAVISQRKKEKKERKKDNNIS